MNQEVNTNFTGDDLRKLKGNNWTEEQWNDITRDIFSYKYITDDYDNCYDKNNIDLMIKAIVEVSVGFDGDKKVFDFLEKINSTIVYHNDPKKMSSRELLCMYLNTICKWSSIFKHDFCIENDYKLYKLQDLYSGLKNFIVNDLGLPRRRIIDYKKFRKHLQQHTLVKPSGSMFNTVKINAESVCGLPQNKKI